MQADVDCVTIGIRVAILPRRAIVIGDPYLRANTGVGRFTHCDKSTGGISDVIKIARDSCRTLRPFHTVLRSEDEPFRTHCDERVVSKSDRFEIRISARAHCIPFAEQSARYGRDSGDPNEDECCETGDSLGQ